MAFSVGDAIRLTLFMNDGFSDIMNVWDYEITTVPSPTIQASHIAEAWWNHVKATYRASVASTYTNVFRSVNCKSMMSATGDYGDFAIPAAENAGTRTVTGDAMPQFAAAAVKLIVPSRLTRPGQKRFGFMFETDNVGGTLQSTLSTLVAAICTNMLPKITLGSPAAALDINPIVLRVNAAGLADVWQEWSGIIVNPIVTTQNTRKRGHGM